MTHCITCASLRTAKYDDGSPMTDNRGRRFAECANPQSSKHGYIIWEPSIAHCPHHSELTTPHTPQEETR